MKINIDELKNIKKLSYTVNDTVLNIFLNDENELVINTENPSLNLNKDWIKNVVDKANTIAKERHRTNTKKSYTVPEFENGKPLDRPTCQIIDTLRNDSHLRDEIKSMSKYGEKTEKERLNMFLNSEDDIETVQIPSILSASTITYYDDNKKF